MDLTILFAIKLFVSTTFFYVALNFYFRYQVRVDYIVLLSYLVFLIIAFDLIEYGIRMMALWEALILIVLLAALFVYLHFKKRYPVFLVGLRKDEVQIVHNALEESFPNQKNYCYQEKNWFYLVLHNVQRKERNQFLTSLEKSIQAEPKQWSIALYVSLMLALFLMVLVWRFM